MQINGEQIDPLATIVHRDDAYRVGKGLVKRLKELIPRQMFKVPIQAAIGARIVASESISGLIQLLRPLYFKTRKYQKFLVGSKFALRSREGKLIDEYIVFCAILL